LGISGIEPEEYILFKNVMLSLQLPEKIQQYFEDLIKLPDNLIDISFDSKKQSLFFLKEGIQLGYIDGNYDTEEKQVIYKIADKLGISKDSVEKIEKWVLEGMEWVQRGEKLLDLEV
jgi:hypothetical protein